MKDKIIIHNYTELPDRIIIQNISNIIDYGKISNSKYGKTYCLLSKTTGGILISCDRRNNTYTFKIFKE